MPQDKDMTWVTEKFKQLDGDFDDFTEDGRPQCRVCWSSEEPSTLLSPCQCSGTQKHVHLKCLRRWQENVQKRDISDERAFRCSVCRAFFSVPPPKGRPGSGGALLQALRGLGGALCVTLLACGLSGPPWPHLAFLLLLLFGSRWPGCWLPGLAVLLCGSLVAGLHTRGLRLVLRLDGGGRLGVAVIRHGAPVPGVGPGVLLVASEGLDHSPIFRRSVVLLTQHGRGGARGVMLTQPMAHPPALPAALTESTAGAAASGAEAAAGVAQHAAEGVSGQRSTGSAGTHNKLGAAADSGDSGGSGGSGSDAAPASAVALKHFLGGPVGMPGEGVNHEVVVLHFVPGVPSAHRIVPLSNRTAAPGAGAAGSASPNGSANATNAASSHGGGGSSTSGAVGGTTLFEGGSVGEVMQRAAAAAAASMGGSGQGLRSRGGRAYGGAAPPVLLFHGVCAWAEGQLEGELRSGSWGFAARSAAEILHLLDLPHDELWQALAGSPSVTRVR